MNWDDLRFFLALAKEGTVSGAGRALSVKHTTVARRIAAFEEQLGSRLFDRIPSGYVLTQVGENLISHALGVEELVSAADREVMGMDAELKGSLKLASSYDLFTRLITPNIHQFTNQYPAIDVELISSASLVDLGSRQADIAIRISPAPPENLVGRELTKLGYGVYASEQYLLNRPKQEQLVLWRHDLDIPQWVSDHFSDGKVVVRVSDVMTMKDLVTSHLGLARMPCYVADAEPTLRRLDVSLDPSGWGLWILNHADLRATARVRACREFLMDTIGLQRELIEGRRSNYA